jgi:hypothetical protein
MDYLNMIVFNDSEQEYIMESLQLEVELDLER